ncbi:CBS domain-containing protein, partial [Escherichia coli]|nr:CBS domain-containing protein [Escherichia coli]
ILTDIEPIQGDTSLNEVISTVAQAPCAVPVINEKNRYLGVISKGMLLQALDKETPNE